MRVGEKQRSMPLPLLFDTLWGSSDDEGSEVTATESLVPPLSPTPEETAVRAPSPPAVRTERDAAVDAACESYLAQRTPRRPGSKVGSRKPLDRHSDSSLLLPKEKHRLLDEESIDAVYTSGCGCKNKCLQTVSLRDIKASRLHSAKLTHKERKRWAANELQAHRKAKQEHFAFFGPKGERLCKRAWCLVWGIGSKLFPAARQMALNKTQLSVRSGLVAFTFTAAVC